MEESGGACRLLECVEVETKAYSESLKICNLGYDGRRTRSGNLG